MMFMDPRTRAGWIIGQLKASREFRYSFVQGALFTAPLFFFALHFGIGQSWAVGVGWLLLLLGVTVSLKASRRRREHSLEEANENA